MRHSISGILILFCILLTGCFSPSHTISIRTIASPAYGVGYSYPISYVIVPPANTPANLEFQEYAHTLEKAISPRGYYRIPGDQILSARISITLSYSSSDPIRTRNISTSPVYGQVGYKSITHEGNTLKLDPAYGVVGTRTNVETEISYHHTLTLEAQELYFNSQGKVDPTLTKQVWKTDIGCTSDTANIRELIPAMLAAAAPYVGTNSRQEITRNISSDDPLVKILEY